MKITTNQFGEIEFTEDKVISFNNGLFGFEYLTKYLFVTRMIIYFIGLILSIILKLHFLFLGLG